MPPVLAGDCQLKVIWFTSADTFTKVVGAPGTVPAIMLTAVDCWPSPTSLIADTESWCTFPIYADGIKSWKLRLERSVMIPDKVKTPPAGVE